MQGPTDDQIGPNLKKGMQGSRFFTKRVFPIGNDVRKNLFSNLKIDRLLVTGSTTFTQTEARDLKLTVFLRTLK